MAQSAMAKNLSDHLLYSLDGLPLDDFKRFKFTLQNCSLEKEQPRIPRGQLQPATPVDLAQLLLTHYGETSAVRLTLQILRAINQNLLADELHKALTSESLDEGASRRDSSSDMARAAEALEGEGPRVLDTWWWESSLFQTQSKVRIQGKQSSGIRRNSSSAGRLQNLCGSIPRREAVQCPRKQRPRSLELTNSSEDKELAFIYMLLLLQLKMQSESQDLSCGAPQGQAAEAVNKGSRLPGHSKFLEEAAASSSPAMYLLSRGKACKHSKASAGPTASGVGVPLISGRTQDRAVCPLCHAVEEDTYTHKACSCSMAVSGWARCRARCQALLSGKRQHGSEPQESLNVSSPKTLLQCKRHPRQAELLFHKNHKESLCHICSLSLEDQGHSISPPTEQAAQEYKEKIQKRLQTLKELKRSGGEQWSFGDRKEVNFLKDAEVHKQKLRSQLRNLSQFLEQQEQLFSVWLENLGQTINQVWGTYATSASWALLDKQIKELEAKQCQPIRELMQDIGGAPHRTQSMMAPELWATPLEMLEKLHLLYQRSELMEKNMRWFSETLRSEMEPFMSTCHPGLLFPVPELTGAQAHAVNVTLDRESAHPNLIFSDDLKSVRLGNKGKWLLDNSESFNSCILSLGSPCFSSGCQYWEVEVGDKTGWVLGVCKASTSWKGSLVLCPENGYWVLLMVRQNEYRASTLLPTHLKIREPLRCVGIFLDYKVRGIFFYNVTTKSHIYTFTDFSSSEPLRPIFSPGSHDGGKNMDPLTICPMGGQGPC